MDKMEAMGARAWSPQSTFMVYLRQEKRRLGFIPFEHCVFNFMAKWS